MLAQRKLLPVLPVLPVYKVGLVLNLQAKGCYLLHLQCLALQVLLQALWLHKD